VQSDKGKDALEFSAIVLQTLSPYNHITINDYTNAAKNQAGFSETWAIFYI